MKTGRFLKVKSWMILMLLFLTGCDAVKGLGTGLGDVFKKIKLP